MTKVDIISGFLGAGKTTFIKQLIEQVFTGEKLVLIENEFGFLKDAGIEITEMNSGCICCTLVGDFSKALQKVLEEYQPDRVLIEPSGVGKLSDIVKAIEDVKQDAEIEVNARITVVDGKKAKLYLKNFGEFFEDQVKHASTIVISRTQTMTDEKIEECVHMLREENADAAIISTPWEELGREAICHALEHGVEIEGLLEHPGDTCCCHGEHAHEGHAHGEHAHGGHAHEEHVHGEHAHGGHAHGEHAHEKECGCMLIIIRRKNAAMITVMITVKITKNPAADITMGITTTMGIITMQTRYSQAGAKRPLTSTRMKNWISF